MEGGAIQRRVYGGAEERCLTQADARTRTADPFITSEVLYQLSYVGEGGLSVAAARRYLRWPWRGAAGGGAVAEGVAEPSIGAGGNVGSTGAGEGVGAGAVGVAGAIVVGAGSVGSVPRLLCSVVETLLAQAAHAEYAVGSMNTVGLGSEPRVPRPPAGVGSVTGIESGSRSMTVGCTGIEAAGGTAGAAGVAGADVAAGASPTGEAAGVTGGVAGCGETATVASGVFVEPRPMCSRTRAARCAMCAGRAT
jgi:hypothetical protein